MIATAEEISAIEQFFNELDLPMIFKLNEATTINNLPQFIEKSLDNLKSPSVSDRVNGPRWDDLLEIKTKLVSSNNLKTSA